MTKNETIKGSIIKLKEELSTSYNKFDRDEHVFGGVCVKNEFFEGRNFSADDWEDTFTDQGNDGGIDWITSKPEEEDCLKVIQTKYTQTQPSYSDIKEHATKLITGHSRLLENDPTLNAKIRNIFDTQVNTISENHKTEYHLFYSCQISPQIQKQANEIIKSNHPAKKVIIHTSSDIEEKIFMNMDESPHVKEDKIRFFEDHGHIKAPQGIVLNISAQSLKELYKKRKSQGLFAQNLRKFVKKQSVDNSINHTLSNSPDAFWERNNGIIITCKEYKIEGNYINLFEFSIVNGCQTTNLIGQRAVGNKHEDDFGVVCKIIPCGNDQERSEKIAEASNKQKAITAEDLKANQSEQKKLKAKMENLTPPISIQIKRGQTRVKNHEIATTNKNLGKLILSCYLQKPGTARSNTAKIFGDETTYETVFKRPYSANNYADLLRIEKLYDEYSKKNRNEDFKDFVKYSTELISAIRGLASHAKFFVISFTILMFKIKKDKDFKYGDYKGEDLDIQDKILNPKRSNDFKKHLFSLWKKTLVVIAEVYLQKLKLGETTGTSNFCKTDPTYAKTVLPHLLDLENSPSFKDDLKIIMEDVFDVKD